MTEPTDRYEPLPLVLIDGTGDVWVRDYQPGIDRYQRAWCDDEESYATISDKWGVSTWLMSSKSVPS